jgi:hypothetical protein
MRVEDKPLFWCDLDGRDKTIDHLRAEVEALRADAGRYRWLRRDITSLSDIKRMQDIVTNLCEDHMDAAIDAAKEAGNG